MEIRFLNVDLEIESSENLQPIVEDFGENVSVLYHGESGSGFNIAAFTVRFSGDKDIDGIISSFCLFIENLLPEAKEVWNKCHSKRFDAGFQSGNIPRNYKTEIRADTMERIAKIGASFVVTIYPEPSR